MENGVSNTQQKQKILFYLLASVLVVIHFVFLMVYFEPAISTPDANGYFAQARLIANNGQTYQEPESILQYVGHHWLNAGDNRYFCRYPPGLPAILAVVFKILGPKATLYINPLMASLSLFALFLLCRLWIGGSWGLFAAALMAFNPFANEHALAADAHTAIIFFLIWGLFFLAQWAKTYSPYWAFSAGLFIGMLPTIRYPAIIFCFAVGVFVLINYPRNRGFWRSLLPGVISTAIPIVALCIHHQLAFKGFWKTAYTLSNEQANFGGHYFISYSFEYLQKLVSEGCALVFVFGVIGIAVLCIRQSTRKWGMLLAMLVIPITLLYMSYYWPPDPQSMRFLLPTFFIYTIACVWFLRLLAEKHRIFAWVGSALILLVTMFWGLPRSIQSMHMSKNLNAVLVKVTHTLEKRVEPGSILIANEGLNQHLDFLGYWRLADASILTFHGNEGQDMPFSTQNSPKHKMPREIETLLEHYEGLTGHVLFSAFSDDIWEWAGNHRKVFLLISESRINICKKQLSQCDELIMIEKIELPKREFNKPKGFRPPIGPAGNQKPPRGLKEPIPHAQGKPGTGLPCDMEQRFGFLMKGEPLFLVEWTREFSW